MRHRAAAALLVPLLLAGVVVSRPARAQSAAEAPAVEVHHSFPLAGETLAVVVEGLEPGENVLLRLLDDTVGAPPPSLLEYLADPNSPQRVLWGGSASDTLWTADDQGRLSLAVALDDPADAGRELALAVVRDSGAGAVSSATLRLHVQPPTLVLLADQGLVRIDLRDGALLDPSLPASGGLRGMALGSTGAFGHVLREGGRLELRAARDWGGEPLSVASFDVSSDTLAGSLLGGAAFVLSRPSGTPFTPAARLQFVDGRLETLLLEPMGRALSGRRAVVSDDGLTAFVAEDDLLVREVDLTSRQPRALFAAGLAGDHHITDLLLDGRRLLVATRGPVGRRGALTVLDLDTGLTNVWPLLVDPLRLVAVAADLALVVPASGSAAQVVESGMPSRLLDQPGTVVLDAASLDGQALLLRRQSDGATLLQSVLPASGVTSALSFERPLPAADRLVSRGTGVLVLLGDPSGAVHLVELSQPAWRTLSGVSAQPGAAFVVLP